MSKRIIKPLIACAIVSVILLGFVVATTNPIVPQEIEQERPKFIISGWDYPDSYDQGIEAIEIYENSTGSWSIVDTVFYDASQAECTFDWDVGVGIRLEVFTYLNSTLLGLGSRVTGRLYQRHYVIVTDSSDTTVFSQQNFTYQYSNEDNWPMYYYQYQILLDFLPLIAEIYTVEIMYEIYY